MQQTLSSQCEQGLIKYNSNELCTVDKRKLNLSIQIGIGSNLTALTALSWVTAQDF